MSARRATVALAFGADPIVVAYGMGVDSTAMLIGLRDRKVRIDLILFADTGSEKPETMAYLPVIQDWLAAQAMPPVTVIKRSSPRAGDTSLHGECLRKSVRPSLAYGGHSCSLKCKVDPQWRYTQRFFGWDRRRQSWPHGPYVTNDWLRRRSSRQPPASKCCRKMASRPSLPLPARRVGMDPRTLRRSHRSRGAASPGKIRLLDVPGLQACRSGLARGRASRSSRSRD